MPSTNDHFLPPGDAHRLFFEHNPLPMYLYEYESLRILEVNDAAIAHYGYSREEFLSMTLLDLRPESEHRVFLESVRKPYGGLANTGVWLHRKKNGEQIHVLIHFGHFPWKDREVRLVVVHDVTAQKVAEDALRASEEQFRVVVENVPDFIIRLDPEGRLQFINRVLPGYRMEDVIGTSSFNFIDPAYHDIHRAKLRAVFERGEASAYEIHGAGSPGEYRWYMNRITPLQRDGKVIGATLVATDITEWKQAEAALRDSESRFRALVESVPGTILVLDRAMHVLFINAAPSGFRREDLQGNDATAFIAQSFRDAFRRLVKETIDSGSGGSLELLAFPGPEGEHWYEARSTPLKHQQGETQALVIAVDIDSRRRAEAQLRDSRDFIERFGRTAPYILYVYDFDEARTVWMNRHFAADLGYTPDQIAAFGDTALVQLLHPEDAALLPSWSARWLATEDGVVLQTEYRMKHADGTWRTLLGRDSIFLRSSTGQVKQIIGSVEDITARKHLEEQLRQSQKLDSIGRLAGGIAHDFNNLLTSILGHIELAEQHMPPDSTALNDLEVIRLAAQRSAELTSQLLSFARKQIVQPRLVNLNELVRETQRLLLRVIGENIEMIAAPFPNLGLTRIDPGQFTQVLINLAVNARDAMPGGGNLNISTGHASIKPAQASAELPAGEYVTLCVSDTGTGMLPDVLSHIFEPFYTTKGVGEGTGLGLATCYGIIKQAQGDIQVQSEVGKGTTFTIYLPRADGGSPTTPEMPRLPNLSGTETILLVEDDEMLRKLTTRFLSAQGYTVLSAHDGETALRMDADFSGDIALLLTDVVMPRMSGMELARTLCQKRPSLCVLMMTGYTEENLESFEHPQGTMAVLQKPFTLPLLSSTIRSLLDRKK